MIKTIAEMFTKKPTKSSDQAILVTFTPQDLPETRRIAKQLLEGNAVLIDFSNTKPSLSIRIVDYLSGMLMALDGDYRKLDTKKFLVSRSKEVSDRFQSELKNI
jgi:cell division inhibitor SepF